MNEGILKSLKTARLRLGLTQVELAHLSGISLAMLQLIESEQANPSLQIIEKLSKVLGFRFELTPDFNWDQLIAHGGPLFETSTFSMRSFKPTETSLRITLIQACLELRHYMETKSLTKQLVQLGRERLFFATEALLLALKTNFPSKFEKWSSKNPIIKKASDFPITGQHIKLKRIATEYLRQYL